MEMVTKEKKWREERKMLNEDGRKERWTKMGD